MPELLTFNLDRPVNQPVADWITSFYQLFASQPVPTLFHKPDEDLIYIADSHSRPRPITSERTFVGEIHNVCNFLKTRDPDQPPTSASFPTQFSPHFFSSVSRRLLPPLTAVTHEPAVYFTSSNEPKILQPGYNRLGDHGIFFWNRSGRSWEPRDTTHHLLKLLSGVPFESLEYKANTIASLLGAVVFDRKIDAPLIAVTGNQPGIGKTKLCASIGYVLTGTEAPPINFHGNEMDKDIGARFREGHRFLLIDNVETKDGRAFRSDRLAMHLTQGHSKSVRELGFSRAVGMKGVLFALTANNCELSEDLAVRALPIRLFKLNPGPMSVYVWDYALEHRFEIYEELLGLALRPPVGPPLSDDYCSRFRFRGWLKFVLPRVRSIPEFAACDLDLAISTGSSFDESLVDLCTWGLEKFDKDKTFTFVAADLLLPIATFPNSFAGLGRVAKSRNDHGKKINLGLYLRQNIGRSCTLPDGTGVKLIRCSQPSEQPIRYGFHVSPPTTAQQEARDAT